MEANHEREIIRAFFVPERRSRYLSLLSTSTGRKKFVSQLSHLGELDPRFVHRLDPGEQKADTIEDNLKKRGAPAFCYVISENACIDRQQMALGNALQAVVGTRMGAFLSCVAGRLAYFEGEEPGERYICERMIPER